MADGWDMKVTSLCLVPLLAATAHAQWTLTELIPDGSINLRVSADGRFFGSTREPGQPTHASLWNADLTQRVDLHPPGVRSSHVEAWQGDMQGGHVGVSDLVWHASLWRRSASSYVSLHRLFQFRTSRVTAIDGDRQFGIITNLADVSRASMWTGTADSWVSLNPPGATSSSCRAAFGRLQAGSARFGDVSQAGLWRGSAESWTSLHPAGRVSSNIQGMSRHVQVGSSAVPWDDTSQTGGFDYAQHACLWRGTAESWIDLHPDGAIESRAWCAAGRWQGGWFGTYVTERACIWTGSVGSMVDLHALLPEKYNRSYAYRMWIAGEQLNVLVTVWDSLDNRWEYIVASRLLPCGADLDDGSRTGKRDENVDVQDLLYFLDRSEQSDLAADLDDGSGEGFPDGGLTIDDLLYFLARFEAGC